MKSGAQEGLSIPAPVVAVEPMCYSSNKPGDEVINEKMTGMRLRQMEHIRGHLWHKYSIMVNQVMVATAKRSKWWPRLNQ